MTDFLTWTGKQMFHACAGVRGALLQGANLLRSDLQRPRDAGRPKTASARHVEGKGSSPHFCTFSRSNPRSPLRDSRLCSRTDGDQADPWALAAATRQAGRDWQKGLQSLFGQRQKRESCCPCVKLGRSTTCSWQNLSQMPARFAIDLRLLFHNEDEANNLTICSHNQATCRVDNKTPTLTVADEDPFVLSPRGYF